jgi:hypothetical protein
MKVHDIAHCRSGDKGDYSLVSVIVYDMKNYEKILKHLTVDKVKKQYGDRVQGKIVRHEMPKTGICIFEMEHALGGGVVRTLRHDGHGKNVSYAMLEIELPDD